MNFKAITLFTFDCYGTIIDWESGILSTIQPLLKASGIKAQDSELLSLYAQFEADEEREYKPYRDVLARVMQRFGDHFGLAFDEREQTALVRSLPYWPAFDDSRDALLKLKEKYEIAILSNIDDDLFAATRRRLGVDFDWIITAQQVGSYKPGLAHFERILQLSDRPASSIVHCGQSPYHDVRPARALGFRTVWVRRRGYGATLPADAEPELEIESLEELAMIATA